MIDDDLIPGDVGGDEGRLTGAEIASLLSAKPDELAKLIHNLTAQKMIEALMHPELGTTPGVLQAALRFLQQNGIEAAPVPGSRLSELADKAPFKLTGTQ